MTISWMGKTVGEEGLGREWEGLEFCFGCAVFQNSVGQPGGCVEQSAGRGSLEFRENKKKNVSYACRCYLKPRERVRSSEK